VTSEGWQRWARVRAQGGLARLSLSNQLLVALARPDATFTVRRAFAKDRLKPYPKTARSRRRVYARA
jgi:hypothetical protein